MKLAYRHDLYAPNMGKTLRLLALFAPFRRADGTLLRQWVRRMEQGEPLAKYLAPLGGKILEGLSARQMKNVGSMVRQALVSWTGLLEDRVRGYITGSTLDGRTADPLTPSDRTILYRVNRHHLWWASEPVLYWRITRKDGDGRTTVPHIEPCGSKTNGAFPLPVPDRLMRLARRMVKQARKRIAQPDLRHSNTLMLDSTVARLERPANPGSAIAWWVRVSTLERGKPVLVPLKRNTYFEREYERTLQHGGSLCGAIQLHRDEDGMLTVSLICDRPDMPPRDAGDSIGIDWGCADALMADSDGRLQGHAMLDRIKQWDREITGRQQWMQRRGLKPTRDPYYRALQHRIRDYVANEIGRILNRYADRTDPRQIKEIILEQLDFRYGGLSAPVNRIITRTGRRILKQRLTGMTGKHGITVTTVPSPYTSQECSSCGYTSNRNRPTRDRLACRFCGRRLHADINAARVIESRRSWLQPKNTGPTARTNTLHLLEQRHRQRWHLPDTWSGPGRSRRSGPPLKPQQPTKRGAGTYLMSCIDIK